jgi:uncharacterized protein
MLTEPLPRTLDVRKAAARGVSISGVLRPLDLQRFRLLLAEHAGVIQADLAFYRDEENRDLVHLVTAAEVAVTCQRCLQSMPLQVGSDSILAIVWSDDQARQLPRHLEPLIAEGESCNLWELVEEELILALPAFSYHETENCKESLAGYIEPAPDEVTDESRPNSFDVLAQLKPGNKH